MTHIRPTLAFTLFAALLLPAPNAGAALAFTSFTATLSGLQTLPPVFTTGSGVATLTRTPYPGLPDPVFRFDLQAGGSDLLGGWTGAGLYGPAVPGQFGVQLFDIPASTGRVPPPAGELRRQLIPAPEPTAALLSLLGITLLTARRAGRGGRLGGFFAKSLYNGHQETSFPMRGNRFPRPSKSTGHRPLHLHRRQRLPRPRPGAGWQIIGPAGRWSPLFPLVPSVKVSAMERPPGPRISPLDS